MVGTRIQLKDDIGVHVLLSVNKRFVITFSKIEFIERHYFNMKE